MAHLPSYQILTPTGEDYLVATEYACIKGMVQVPEKADARAYRKCGRENNERDKWTQTSSMIFLPGIGLI